MAKFYAASGVFSSGDRFSSVTFAKSKKEVKQQLQKALPNGLKILELSTVDELAEGIAPLNSGKAVSISWQEQELLTVSFVFQNIKEKLRADLIKDLDAVIAKYGFLT